MKNVQAAGVVEKYGRKENQQQLVRQSMMMMMMES
jgi:hypothetical protein